jgi:hypothetical protein
MQPPLIETMLERDLGHEDEPSTSGNCRLRTNSTQSSMAAGRVQAAVAQGRATSLDDHVIAPGVDP